MELRYDDEQFRLRVRDDGKGIDPAVLSNQGVEGQYGLRGPRERATLMKGKVVVGSEVEAETEVELSVPARVALCDRPQTFLAVAKICWEGEGVI